MCNAKIEGKIGKGGHVTPSERCPDAVLVVTSLDPLKGQRFNGFLTGNLNFEFIVASYVLKIYSAYSRK